MGSVPRLHKLSPISMKLSVFVDLDDNVVQERLFLIVIPYFPIPIVLEKTF